MCPGACRAVCVGPETLCPETSHSIVGSGAVRRFLVFMEIGGDVFRTLIVLNIFTSHVFLCRHIM